MGEQTMSEPLEQRLIELLSTFCDAPNFDEITSICDHEDSRQLPHAEEQRLNVIAQNLAFLIRAQDDKHNGSIKCGDIFVTMLGWESYCEGLDDATLAVLVCTAKTTKVLQIRVASKGKVLEKLGREVDKMLLKALLLV